MSNTPNFLNSHQDFRLLLPETVWLEAEDFVFAKQISSPETTISENTSENTSESSWQTYLNTLALLALERWLNERLVLQVDENVYHKRVIERDISRIAIAGDLKLGTYKFCAIAVEHLLDEIVPIPDQLIEQAELAPHFYVLMEVLEEEEEVVIRGFLSHSKLIDIQNQLAQNVQDNQLPIQSGFHLIHLSYFDLEPNHLLIYSHYLEASEFNVPQTNLTAQTDRLNQVETISRSVSNVVNSNTTKLSQWLQGVIDEGWKTIDSLISPELALAFSTRTFEQDIKRAKIIDLVIELGNRKFALLLNISPENSYPENSYPETSQEQAKISVLTQLYPLEGEKFLPSELKLTLLSKAGKNLQEVIARSQDNYIQLKPFKGETGKKFSIKVSWGDAFVQENFEL